MILPMSTDNIPEPTIVRSRKRKRTVALHVQQDGSLRVLAPQRTSMKWINAFIAERSDWIAHRRKAIHNRNEKAPLIFQHGAKLPFQGKDITLVVEQVPQDCAVTTSYNPEKQEINITLPTNMPPEVQKEEIKTELTLWYKKQARALLPERMDYWSEHMSMKPTRLFFSNTKQQWGSCNSKDEIRLNWRLILASQELYDYVIVHELCHIPHKNHGAHFWSLCADILPDMVKRRQALKKWEEIHHPASFP